MAAFSYQNLHHPFHLHPPSFANNTTTLKMSDATGDDFSQFYHPHDAPSPLGHGAGIQLPENESSLANKQSSESSIVVDKVESGEQVTQKINSKEKKRKKRNGSVFSSVQSKSKAEGRRTKQKKQDEKKNEEEVAEEAPPPGYIHVRARRGQATDSHSLAERVRREKISERMKLLQRLVPGCDKVSGKALVLDEIINYVQSLQNQVEFLSMKLASVNPLSYHFEHDLDSSMVATESMSRSMASSNLQQCSGFTNYISTFSHPFMDHSPSVLLDQRHKSMPFCDSVNPMWGGGDPDQKFTISTALSNNLYSFNQ